MKHRIILYITFSLSILLTSCSDNKNKDTSVQTPATNSEDTTLVSISAQQIKTAGIQTDTLSFKTLSATIKVNGVLDVPPQNWISIASPIGGFVQSTPLLQGQHVQKGEVIATLQDLSYIQMQQDYLDQKSQLQYLQAEYERQKELAAQNINAQKTLQLSKANYESMLAKVNGLKAKFQLLHINTNEVEKGIIKNSINIYAPKSGYVSAVNVNLGKYVNAGEVLFEIIDPSHIHAELTVFEKDILNLKPEQKVTVVTADNKEREAYIYLIGKKIADDRTIRVHCHFAKEDKSLIPGSYVTAYIATKNLHQPALPDEAIINYAGKPYVFIADKTHKKDSIYFYRMTEVATGISEGGYTSITLPDSIDKKNSLFVIKGAYDLLGKLKNSGEEE
jgi:cobalt-zinc-cadmium efflux system membrane fusion protein